MPRYLVERALPEDVNLPFPGVPEQERQLFIENNTLLGAVWIHSYVSADREKCFCLYEAPSPETVRKASARNRLPVDRIVEVRLLDPTS